MGNLAKRVLIGVVAIPAILFLTFTGGDLLFYFTLIISVFALYEFYALFIYKNFNLLIYFSLPISTAAYILLYSDLVDPSVIVILYLILIFSVEIFKKDHSPLNVFLVAGGFVYIMLPLLLLNSLAEIEVDGSGINLVMIIFALIWLCDTAAYFGGKSYGRNKLSKISPHKTIEGSVTGFIVTIIVSLIFHFIFPDILELKDFLVIGALVGIFSQIGDLFESMIKRFAGVKDSSGIIPGHGGVLDRFDGLFFVTPIVFAYMELVS